MRLTARLPLVLACSLALGARAEAPPAATQDDWHRVVGLLQYVEGDYEAALQTQDAAELAEQKGFADEIVRGLTALGAPAEAYLARAKAIQVDIDAVGPASTVAPACGALALDILKEQRLAQAPRRTPDLTSGRALYASLCASCHGATGAADTEAAKGMEPHPANFLEAPRMEALSPYKAYNTTAFGIAGTPMPAFAQLKEDDRWAVAFFLFTLRQPPCQAKTPRTGLDELATSTDGELAKKYGAEEAGCLRQSLPQSTSADALATARDGLTEARRLHAAGQKDAARKAVIDAYLNGLEPIEPALRARSPKLVTRLEEAFTTARVAADGTGDFDASVAQVLALLDEAEKAPSTSDFWSVFVTAMLILLREGFEAVVIVGALLAVLKKLDAPKLVRVVHLGWVTALFAGALAFLFGQALLAGANREWMESLVALAAVGMLLYAAMWLNARANMSHFMGELRGKMKEALGSGSTVGLFVISFSAVGRETFETALFLQGLASDSPTGVAWGAAAGLVLLVGFILLVRRVGYVLPMKTLFNASTVLLVATAVMLLGKGLHGLQEVGVLPLSPLPLPGIPALGVYADAVTLLPQVLLAVVPMAWLGWRRRGQERKTAPVSPPNAAA